MAEAQLGKRMTEMYGKTIRPRQHSIIGEVEARFGDDTAQVVTQHRARGYTVGGLSEARTRFTEVRGVVVEWPDEDHEAEGGSGAEVPF